MMRRVLFFVFGLVLSGWFVSAQATTTYPSYWTAQVNASCGLAVGNGYSYPDARTAFEAALRAKCPAYTWTFCGNKPIIGWTYDARACPAASITATQSCPGGGTPSNETCTCAGNYDPTTKTCVSGCPEGQIPDLNGICSAPPVTCDAGKQRSGVMLSAPSSGSVCGGDGCAYSGDTQSDAPIAGYYGPMGSLSPYFAVTWINTGKTCGQAGLPSNLGRNLIENPGSDAVGCPTGQVLTVTGGVGTCATPADPTKAIGSPTPSNLPPPSGGGLPSGQGGTPGNPVYFDKSGLATESGQSVTNANLDKLHNDLTVDGVKIKETGTPSDSSLAAQDANFNSAAQTQLDAINNVSGSGKVSALDWVWTPSIPDGACSSMDFSGRWASGVSLDLCSSGGLDTLRAILAWAYSLFAAAYIWGRASGSIS